MSRLTGRVAVVFGGGHGGEGPHGVTGIGFACARTLAAEGATVVVVDRDPDAADRTMRAIQDDGGRVSAIVTDVLDEAQVVRCVADVLGEHGQLDVVHNVVGTTLLGGPEEISLAQWRSALAVNLDSVFLTTKHTLGPLTASRGCIVNISSTGSIRWTGYAYPAYAAAKAGVNQLTRSLALEYATRGVRVNAILAGLIDTPLVYRELSEGAEAEDVRSARDALSPTGAMGTAQDVADAALFLSSDESRYVTGVLLPVDGGLHVRAV